MSSTNSGKKYWLIPVRILILLIVVAGVLKSGPPANYFNPNGLLFVLVGGVALMMISFPGAEIGRALRHAAGSPGSNAEIRNSIHFWEAAGRGFWLVGGLRSVVSIIIGFAGMKFEETAGISSIIGQLAQSLLATLYGGLLAVICFVPCWKLMEILQSSLSAPNPERNETPLSIGRPGWGFGTILGYALFLSALISTTNLRNLSLSEVSQVCTPPLLVMLGGVLVLIQYMGVNNSRLTLSTAFAGMGFISCLMGFIQMLIGMTDPSPNGIAHVAGAIAFIIASCFTALLGMALIGAPLEDRAIRTGRVDAPSTFSRVSWYGFPLPSLIFLVLVFTIIITPLPTTH
jgi:flagellar motor component MotA